jgi:ribosomal protein S18 acetylase RimI-like enzyme
MTPKYYIRDCKRSDLAQVADVLMLSFSPGVNTDPIRGMFELMRLQTTFPAHHGEKHLFLVACEPAMNKEVSGFGEKIIGFCKVDGRDDTDMHRTLIESFPLFEGVIPKSPYATDLAVHPNYRRIGIGSQIMHEVELRVKGWGADYFFLGVESDNQSALRLYRDIMGYEIFIEGMAMMSSRNKSVHLLRHCLR